MRHFLHIEIESIEESEKKLLPVFLHYNDLNWFTGNFSSILKEICNIIVENIETIERRARGGDKDSPPTRLHSTTGTK